MALVGKPFGGHERLLPRPVKHSSKRWCKSQPRLSLKRKQSTWLASQTSMRKHLEAKSLQLHQERVTRYQQIHELHAKKVDVTTIARKLGVSRKSRL